MHWGMVMTYGDKILVITGSGNGLGPIQHQTITWNNAYSLSILLDTRNELGWNMQTITWNNAYSLSILLDTRNELGWNMNRTCKFSLK